MTERMFGNLPNDCSVVKDLSTAPPVQPPIPRTIPRKGTAMTAIRPVLPSLAVALALAAGCAQMGIGVTNVATDIEAQPRRLRRQEVVIKGQCAASPSFPSSVSNLCPRRFDGRDDRHHQRGVVPAKGDKLIVRGQVASAAIVGGHSFGLCTSASAGSSTGFLAAASTQQVEQPPPAPLPRLAPNRGPIAPRKRKTRACAAAPRARPTRTTPIRRACGARPRSDRDAGDGYAHAGIAALQRSCGHRKATSSLTAPWRAGVRCETTLLLLLRRSWGHEAAIEPFRAAGDARDRFRRAAAGARFGRRDDHAASQACPP